MDFKVMLFGTVLAAFVVGIVAYTAQLDSERNLRVPIVETCVKHRVNQRVVVER